jgi:hypothetical protein
VQSVSSRYPPVTSYENSKQKYRHIIFTLYTKDKDRTNCLINDNVDELILHGLIVPIMMDLFLRWVSKYNVEFTISATLKKNTLHDRKRVNTGFLSFTTFFSRESLMNKYIELIKLLALHNFLLWKEGETNNSVSADHANKIKKTISKQIAKQYVRSALRSIHIWDKV